MKERWWYYSISMSNPLVERSFRHMGWANSQMLNIVSALPDDAINFSAWNPDWTVGKIAHHIVVAEARLISRITEQQFSDELEAPTTAQGIKELISICRERDAQLLKLSNTPEEIRTFKRFGKDSTFLTSTILAQATNHATEHRAQISDILAANEMDVLNLDEIDLWAFETWEKSH